MANPKNEDHITILKATSEEEKQAIFRFRYQIHVEELHRNIPDADHGNKRIFDDCDHWGQLFYAQLGQEIVGTVCVNVGSWDYFPKEWLRIFRLYSYRIETAEPREIVFATKIMIAPRQRRSTLLFRLMAKPYELALQHNIKMIFSGTNPYLLPLFKQLGYRQYAPGFLEPGYGFMIPTLLLTDDLIHLSSVHSPYLRIARKFSNSTLYKSTLAINKQMTTGKIPCRILRTSEERRHPAWYCNNTNLSFINFLAFLSEAEIKKFLHISTLVECRQNHLFILPGDICNELNLLLRGAMVITPSQGPVYQAHPGNVIGSIGLSGQTQHTIIAVADSDCKILTFSRFSFEKLQRTCPEIARKIIKQFSC
jgi:CRP-like cAMP-binding protein